MFWEILLAIEIRKPCKHFNIITKKWYFLYVETYGLWARSDAYGKWAQVAFPGVSFAWKGPCTPINTSQLYFHNIITRKLLLSVLCICYFVVFITMSLQYFAEITFLFCNEIVLLFLFVLCLFVWLLHNNFSMFGWNIRYKKLYDKRISRKCSTVLLRI